LYTKEGKRKKRKKKNIWRPFCPCHSSSRFTRCRLRLRFYVLSLNCHKSALCLATSALKNYNNCYLRISEHEMCQLAANELAKRTQRNERTQQRGVCVMCEKGHKVWHFCRAANEWYRVVFGRNGSSQGICDEHQTNAVKPS